MFMVPWFMVARPVGVGTHVRYYTAKAEGCQLVLAGYCRVTCANGRSQARRLVPTEEIGKSVPGCRRMNSRQRRHKVPFRGMDVESAEDEFALLQPQFQPPEEDGKALYPRIANAPIRGLGAILQCRRTQDRVRFGTSASLKSRDTETPGLPSRQSRPRVFRAG